MLQDARLHDLLYFQTQNRTMFKFAASLTDVYDDLTDNLFVNLQTFFYIFAKLMDLCLNSEFMMIFNTSSLKNGKKLARNEEMQVLTIFMYCIFQINRCIGK